MGNFVDLLTATFALIGGGTGSLVVKHFLDKRKRDEYKVFSKGMDSMANVYDCLNEVVENAGVKRAMILHSENNGGIPQGSCDLFVTISHEMHIDSKSIRRDYQRTPVDYEYIKMMTALISSPSGFLHLTTDYLPPSQLKDIYLEDDIKQSLVFVLQRKKHRFRYCSFNFGYEERIPQDVFRKCSFQVAKIKQIFDKDEKRLRSLWKRR